MPRTPGLYLLGLFLLVPLGCAEEPAGTLLAPDAPDARLFDGPGIEVMSYNLYLGADIDPLLDPNAGAAAVLGALAQLQRTNFPARAQAIAAEIVAHEPDLVGLQEVSTFLLPPGLGLPAQIPYLDILMAAIAAQGGSYYVAEFQTNVQISLPVVVNNTLLGFATYVDGDAIIARTGVDTEQATSDWFETQQTLQVGGQVFDNLRGWNAVTATVDGQRFRFVNTHLEIQRFADVQVEQAKELVELFGDLSMPVIMVGDFNSAANPHPREDQSTESYRILREAGFADLWLREAHSNEGLTCCQAPALDNTESQLHSRLDLVLAKYGPAGFGGTSTMDVLGEEPSDLITLGPGYTVWPSDHAGVVATLWPAYGGP